MDLVAFGKAAVGDQPQKHAAKQRSHCDADHRGGSSEQHGFSEDLFDDGDCICAKRGADGELAGAR